MALKLTNDFKGVLFAPRKNEIKPGSGVLYPRVVELHCAGEKNGTLLATFEYYVPVEPAFCSVPTGIRVPSAFNTEFTFIIPVFPLFLSVCPTWNLFAFPSIPMT